LTGSSLVEACSAKSPETLFRQLANADRSNYLLRARPPPSVRLPVGLLAEMAKLPQRPGAADRGAWPIAAPLERVAKLLRVDLADVTAVAERVARFITADGRRLSSVELIERAIDPGYEALASPRLEIIPEDARRPWSADSTGCDSPFPHEAEHRRPVRATPSGHSRRRMSGAPPLLCSPAPRGARARHLVP